MFKVGCAEQLLDVPLLIELYGYGPYAGRRNTGTHEPLYCRAFSFHDGEKRALIIYTDICTTDDCYAREMRSQIASMLRMNPEGIAFVATHTHSGPALAAESTNTSGSSGIRNAGWQECWKQAVVNVALAAVAGEEEIVSADAGKAPLERPVGKNRANPEANITDPAIRWMRFKRADGSVKLLIHNHGVHGVADNGLLNKKVSSDWMGAANRKIREQKLADYALFLLGPCGDINTRTSCAEEKREAVGDELAGEYVKYLARDLSAGVEVNLSGISFLLKTFEFPTVRQTPEELRKDAEIFRSMGVTELQKQYWSINAARLDEMALLAEKGFDLGVFHDLQILRLGEAEFFFIPGELFVEPGIELLNRAASKYSFAATVSNGNGAYFFTEKCAQRYPSPNSTGSKFYGYYEIYGYMHALRFKYQDHIASFIINNLLDMEAKR